MSAIRLFVYGTLKRGFSNFQRFCPEVSEVVPAAVWGALYHLPVGYPMLAVPPEGILALGSADPLNDARLQAETQRIFSWPGDRQKPAFCEETLCQPILGEILTLADPVGQLPQLDELEDYQPPSRNQPQHQGEYHRVLMTTCPPERMVIWVYVAPDGRLPQGAVRIGPSWPSEHSLPTSQSEG